MIELHRAIIVTGIFFLMPLFTFLLLVSSILSLLEGDKSAFIGIAIALLFMSIDAGAIYRYLRNREKALEKDIQIRVWRDATAPLAISLIFLFFSILNFAAGQKEGGIIFFVIFASFLIVGALFYYQKRKIIG